MDKGSKISRFEYWTRVQSSRNCAINDLIAPKISTYNQNLWRIYIDIRQGCDDMTYPDLESYQNISGYTLTPIEASLMLQIDNARKSEWAQT